MEEFSRHLVDDFHRRVTVLITGTLRLATNLRISLDKIKTDGGKCHSQITMETTGNMEVEYLGHRTVMALGDNLELRIYLTKDDMRITA